MRTKLPPYLASLLLLACAACSDSGRSTPDADPNAGDGGGADAATSCGDGELRPDEQCESFELRGESCESQGFSGGQLRCSDECKLDTSGCFTCGNGTIEATEACDGDALDGATCATLLGSDYAGSVVCSADCVAVDTSGCAPVSGPALDLAACDPSASVPCADSLDCVTTTLGSFCAVECDPAGGSACGAGSYCYGIDDTGVCRPKPGTGAECSAQSGCADAAESCEPAFASDLGERSVCASTCSSAQINRSADSCASGRMCLATPGKRVVLQDGNIPCTDPSACDADHQCLDVGEQSSDRRCARYVGICGETIPLFGFRETGDSEASLCDLERPTLGARYCGLSAGSTPIENPAVVECYPYFADVTSLGVCVAYCDPAFGDGNDDLDCGVGAQCMVPSAPELFVSQSDPPTACTASDMSACDSAHDRCIDLGGGPECARALRVCVPNQVAP